MKQHIINLYYACKRKIGGITFPPSIQIIGPKQTLELMSTLLSQKKAGAYLRFGDGEVNILEGGGAIEQSPNKLLAKEMRGSFELAGATILKSLMIHSKKFGWSEGMALGMHLTTDSWAEQLLTRVFPYFIGCNIYSHAAFAYSAVYAKEDFITTIKLIQNYPVIFVGNTKITDATQHALFGSRITHIPTKPKDTYNEVNSLEKEILSALQKNTDFNVIIFAAGPTSNVLQKRLIEKNVNAFSIDIGSTIDAFSDNNSRAWIDNVPGGRTYWSNLLKEIQS